MTIGIILIVAILILGGVLATLGDRIGTKVGKARLSLFNLRPRKTAVLITIVTGVLISGSTLGILFATSQPLRRGIFEYDETQKKLRTARRELEEARKQQANVASALTRARNQQADAQARLNATNKALQSALAQKAQTEEELEQTQQQLNRVESNFRQTQQQIKDIAQNFSRAQAQLKTVTEQASDLRDEIAQLQSERQELVRQRDDVKQQIVERDREIAEREAEIAERNEEIAERDAEIIARNKALAERDEEIEIRNRAIAQREQRLKQLEEEQAYLDRQVRTLERYYQDYQGLRQGNVALLRGQILATGLVRIPTPDRAAEALDQLLREANRTAVQQVTRPGSTEAVDEQVIQITNTEVEQLINQISDGQEYVVRILSAGNYVRGETAVRVFADAALNQLVFLAGEVVASTSVDPSTMNDEQIMERLDLLVESSKFRARRAGIFGSTIQIANGQSESLLNFVQQLKQYEQPLDIRAVTAESTYTAGPVKLELVAIRDGQVIFRT